MNTNSNFKLYEIKDALGIYREQCHVALRLRRTYKCVCSCGNMSSSYIDNDRKSLCYKCSSEIARLVFWRSVCFKRLARLIFWRSACFKELPEDLLNHIMDMVNTSDKIFLNREQEKRAETSKFAAKIQKFYRARKLVGSNPYDFCTLHTLKRFYVVKYEPEWLKHFPMSFCNYFNLPLHEPYRNIGDNYVEKFYSFCGLYGVGKADLESYGW